MSDHDLLLFFICPIKKDATKQKVLSLQEVGQKRKINPSLTLQAAKFFPLKRFFLNQVYYTIIKGKIG